MAICSPGEFHAEQVEAATASGKRGILCEKPLRERQIPGAKYDRVVG